MGPSSLKAIAAPKGLDAGRLHGQAFRPALLQVLHESARCETGGEVIVRAGERTGRLFFFGGRVAWITASSLHLRLTDHLVDKGLANPADISAVFAECRRRGGNFAEMLIAWQLIDRDRMRVEMLEHVSRAFSHILGWGEVETIFVPSSREYRGSLTFSLAEIIETTRTLAPEESEMLDELLQQLDSEVHHPALPAAPPEVLDERVRASVAAQLKQLRSDANCRGSCFVGDGGAYSDLSEAAGIIEKESCSTAAAMLREAGAASAKVGLGACGEVTLVGAEGALMAWQVTCEGAGRGLLMVLLGREASLPLTRIVVERRLAQGPLRPDLPVVGP